MTHHTSLPSIGTSVFAGLPIMSRTPLQLYIGCVYHNESTSRWPSWHFVHMLYCLAPPYLNDIVRRVADLPGCRRLRSSSSHQLLVPAFRLTTVGRRTFPVAASLLCNSLSSDIQSSPSLLVFRQRFKIFLFRQSFPIAQFCDSTAPSWTS